MREGAADTQQPSTRMLIVLRLSFRHLLAENVERLVFYAPHFTLVTEAHIAIDFACRRWLVGWLVGRWLVGRHARALWPNGAS